MDGYSVLMSVYHRESAPFLRQSMDSMFGQTVPPREFVLVCDGPLTDKLDRVIEEEQAAHGDVLKVVRLEKNVGLGAALNQGLQACTCELVARMDSDDISLPDRCEHQLEVFREKPEIVICGGLIEEFSTDPAMVESIRTVPETDEEIRVFAKKRNPFNHVTVMYRKAGIDAAGGYQSFYLLEDYYLWIRLLHRGEKGYNLQRPLVRVRTGEKMFERRGGWKYVKSQAALFRYMRSIGMISGPSCAKSIATRFVSGLIPGRLRRALFMRYNRKTVDP